MPLKIGESTRGLVAVHVDGPRLRDRLAGKSNKPIIRIANAAGKTISYARAVEVCGTLREDERHPLPGYPTAICVIRTRKPVKRLR